MLRCGVDVNGIKFLKMLSFTKKLKTQKVRQLDPVLIQVYKRAILL